MKLLVVSNYFPPCFIGGYELGCRDVVERLRARGHSVTVLTSDYRRADAVAEPGVIRQLRLAEGKSGIACHLQNLFAFFHTTFSRSPDIVYFWNQSGLSFWLAPFARLVGFCVVFFLSDVSFTSWRVGALLRKFVSRKSPGRYAARLQEGIERALGDSMFLTGRPVIGGARCHFASGFLRDLNRGEHDSGPDAVVIHWGVDADHFPYVAHTLPASAPLKLLYVGQIIPEKGVHTLVEATALIALRQPGSLTLTIVGGSSKPDYLAKLREAVEARGLSEQIRFAGKLDRAGLPSLYREHDALVLPSIWDEPFAITPLEAMSSGLPVVATITGGSAEIFRDRENSLVFPAGDAEGCAAAIMQLRSDRELYEAIRNRAHELVVRQFTLDRMMDQIEADLTQMAAGRKPAAA